MNDILALLIGGGGVFGVLVTYLTFRGTQGGSKVDWYDRVIKENERLREELNKCEAERYELKEKILRFRILVNGLRMENHNLKEHVKQLLERKE